MCAHYYYYSLKRGRGGGWGLGVLICCFLKDDISCQLFLDLSRDLAWRFCFPPMMSLAAIIPHSKHTFSLVHASYCWGVCGCEERELCSEVVNAHARHNECYRTVMRVFSSSSSSASCDQILLSSRFQQKWSTKTNQRWNPLQKQIQKRQQVNIQHMKSPRYSF